MLPSAKTILSAPSIRVDKHNANESNIYFKGGKTLFETNNSLLIKHANIKENYLEGYGLNLNHDGPKS